MVFDIRAVMAWCAGVLGIPFIIELIKIKEAGEQNGLLRYYTKNFENVIDTAFYTVYVTYFIVRTWVLPQDTMNANPYDQDPAYMQYIAEVNLLTVIIISFSVFRLFRFMSIYPKISLFMSLMIAVLVDMLSFLLFYFVFLGMFAMIQRILRQESTPENYPEIHSVLIQLFFDEFNNSIGNAQPPIYTVWMDYNRKYEEMGNAGRPFIGPIFMVYVIWILWMFN
jgi:hypothetical protein